MFSKNKKLRSPRITSLFMGLTLMFSTGLRAQLLETNGSAAVERLSDGKDNGGNLSFDEVRKQIRDIQQQLRLELFIARTALSLKDVPPNSKTEIVSTNDLDRVIESFDTAEIIPTTKKLFVDAESKDGFETVKVSVDAINNAERGDIQINIYSWALFGWCKKAQLIIHEHMGLEGVERSLEYNLSEPLAAQTSFCANK